MPFEEGGETGEALHSASFSNVGERQHGGREQRFCLFDSLCGQVRAHRMTEDFLVVGLEETLGHVQCRRNFGDMAVSESVGVDVSLRQ